MHEPIPSSGAAAPPLQNSLKPVVDYLSPFNALVVVAVTLLDVATPLLDKRAGRLIALVWAGLAVAALYRFAQQRRAGVSTAAFFARPRHWAAAVTLVLVGVFAVYKLAQASPASAAVQLLPGLEPIQQTLLGIGGDVAAINKALNPTDARGRLTKLGYGLDDESKARAIEACDLDALNLYVTAGERLPLAVPAFGSRGGSVLERPILQHHPKLPAVLRLMAQQGTRFDPRFMLTFTQAQTAAIPDFAALQRQLPAPLRLGFMPPLVHANALTLAVWFDNAEAARTLIALGADREVGVDALLPLVQGGRIVGGPAVQTISSASKEAARLNRNALLVSP